MPKSLHFTARFCFVNCLPKLGDMLKSSRLLLAILLVVTVSACSRNSEPTSPENQELTLNKETDSATVFLKYNQKAIVNSELTIHFEGVAGDSRCPMDANCVWAGDGEINLNLSKENESKDISLHTTLDPKLYDFAGYRIELKTLNPYPKSTEIIKQEDYNVELMIRHSESDTIKPVLLINEENNSLVEHDLLNVNKVQLDKDLLAFEVSYSGGCETHEIDLLAYKSIQKSNPAQVTVMLSHNSNKDACEAMITKEVKFDLSELKEYLKKNYNIQDKVVLLLFDPSGRPLRNPVIEYNF